MLNVFDNMNPIAFKPDGLCLGVLVQVLDLIEA